MNIIVGDKSGFCAGVSYTIKKADELLNKYKNIYCLGEIVHNERVVKSLEDKGMITVSKLEEIPNGSKVIFRAHGEAKKVYEEAEKKNLEVFDLTCGKVRLIHNKIEKREDFVIIVGKAIHPETIGHVGYIKYGCVIENIDDVDKAYKIFQDSGKNEIYIVAQTTFNEEKFEKIVDVIKEKFANIKIEVDKTICSATRERQEEVVDLAKKNDLMIIVGGKNSSNTKELYNLAIDNCKKALLICDVNDLKEEIINENNVGIMAGASTPDVVVEEIIEYLKRKDR